MHHFNHSCTTGSKEMKEKFMTDCAVKKAFWSTVVDDKCEEDKKFMQTLNGIIDFISSCN